MATNVNVRRLALQRTRVVEIHLPKLPDPPAALMRIPGVSEWWKQVLITREQDQQQIYLALLTKAGSEEDTDVVTSDDLTSCCDVVQAALNAETANRISADNVLSNAISALGEEIEDAPSDDTLAWMDL